MQQKPKKKKDITVKLKKIANTPAPPLLHPLDVPKEIWDKMTRADKRHRKVVYEGKEMEAFVYLRKVADKLPKMMYKNTQQHIDHYEMLLKQYLAEGHAGIKAYVDLCKEVTTEDVKTYLEKENARLIKEDREAAEKFVSENTGK